MQKFSKLLRPPITITSANKYDLLAIIVFFLGGAWFLWPSAYWAGLSQIGNSQYGDAAFWWSGALHFAEGIIKDNPNLDYRMGYALFAGSFAAIFGGGFFLFHKLLIAFFLFIVSFLYFSLKPSLGRVAAGGAVALLIFNPFTAEWMAISTSDSLGFILNIAALSCFIFGLRNSLHLGFLAGFGFLLASASLTRPLMNPFIGPAIVILLMHGTVTPKRRFQGLGALAAAFALPTVLWIVTLHGITGSWAMAGQDSTTFYAASDPQIQVWNGTMYGKVEESARNRHKTQNLTVDQVSKEFWLLTKDNYRTHLNYHFSRIIPHILEIAGFSSQKATKNDLLSSRLRASIMLAITIGLAVVSMREKHWLGACLVGLIGVLTITIPAGQKILIAGGALLLTLSILRPKENHCYAIMGLYWWVGVAALYLVGGVFGPPVAAAYFMNALGYRLGFQFFFVNDLITVSMLALISNLQLPSLQLSSFSLPGRDRNEGRSYSLNEPAQVNVSRLFSWATYIFISVFFITGLTGIGVAGYRSFGRTHEAPRPFPPASQIETWWQENKTSLHIATNLEAISDTTSLSNKIGGLAGDVNGSITSNYVLFTGGMSDFIWNLEGQKRSQSIVYLQNNSIPFTMFPNLVYVEFPLHLKESSWVKKQGAWVVRRFADLPPKSNFPFYFSDVSVKAFVPLSEDKKQYDFSTAQVFPLQKYASQLYAAGELKVTQGALEWDSTSGVEKYPRRFLVKRGAAIAPEVPIVLELEISKAIGVRSLSFGWALERASNSVQSVVPALRVRSVSEADATKGRDKTIVYYAGNAAIAPQGIQTTKIALTQSKDNKIKLVLDGVMPDDKIWFYEFNMQSDDFLNE
jgi:hypothetical protein